MYRFTKPSYSSRHNSTVKPVLQDCVSQTADQEWVSFVEKECASLYKVGVALRMQTNSRGFKYDSFSLVYACSHNAVSVLCAERFAAYLEHVII